MDGQSNWAEWVWKKFNFDKMIEEKKWKCKFQFFCVFLNMVSFMLLLWNPIYDNFKRNDFCLQFNLTICAQIIIKYDMLYKLILYT